MTRFGPDDRGLRAADSDREAVADILREQHVAGRLDSDELQERLERCYTAKTYAELDAVIDDLPREPAQSGSTWRIGRWSRLGVVLPLLIAVVALSHGHLIWLAIPLVFFFFVRPLMWRASGGGYGCGPRHGMYL
jgi:Flp pilus assembly protein TadB